MEINSISLSSMAMAATVKQLQQIQEMQMAIMKSIAESQQQLTELVKAAGIGTHIDIDA